MSLKQITAKFPSKCAETGKRIVKGELMYYSYSTKQCYSLDSNKAKETIKTNEDESLTNYIQANEDAFYDSFCMNNNI